MTSREEQLAEQFLAQAVAIIESHEIYGQAHDALWDDFLRPLKPFLHQGDLDNMHFERPKRLDLLVEHYALSGFFRAWLRQQGIEPESLNLPVVAGIHLSTQAANEEDGE